jgi:hypothetical protein
MISLILFSRLRLGHPSCLLSSRFKLYEILINPMRAIVPVNFSLREIITVISFGD